MIRPLLLGLCLAWAGPARAASAAGDDSALRRACLSQAASVTDAAPDAITLDAPIRTAEGASIDASADRGFWGVATLRCLFRQDGAFDRIIALPPVEKPRQGWSPPRRRM
jgi:hypothetical protein